MSKKIIYIAVLLINSVVAFSQVKKEVTTEPNDENARLVNPGGGCEYYVYLDNDLDGYGSGEAICYDMIFDESLTYVSINGDCDDNNPNVILAIYWYLDSDNDGFGGTQTSTKLCYPPNASYIATGGDCNDINSAIHPNTIWYRDADNDTFGNPLVTLTQCTKPVGYVANNIDCNDSSNTVLSSIVWYQDLDQDGFGNPYVSLTQCTQPLGYVSNNKDCIDTDANLNMPTLYYEDADGDSFGNPAVFINSCMPTVGYVTNNLDACPTIAGPLQGCVVPNSSTSFGNRNYIITTTPKVAVTNTQNIALAKDVAINITYYDELGKPNQQIANQQSNTGKDIVTHIEYDNYNRQVKDYLPFKSNSVNMAFDTNALVGTLGYPEYSGQSPFSEKQFESSPLNRVFKQAAPGTTSDWAMGSGHEIKFDYLTNTSTDVVKLFLATSTWNTTNEVFDITLSQTGTTNYADNQLVKTVTKDENWVSGKNNTTEEFKNKEGKVILKRTYDNSVAHDTYYVYDQYNNLTYVLPPLVTNVANQTQLDGLCYQYKYDIRNRLAEKKLPGKQWEYIVYDKLDRVVATGPALSPFTLETSTGWMITKYDVFSRPVLTAWQLQAGSFTSAIRKTLQASYNLLGTILNESKGVSDITISNIAFRYTNNALPTSGYEILTVNYYDDYNFTFAGTIPSTIQNQPVYYNNTTKPKGLTTGTWVRVLGDTFNATPIRSEKSVTFYDEKARPISTIKNNHLGGYTQVDSNFQILTGRINYTVTNHKKDNGASTLITIKDEFTYSDQDRLTKQTHQINGGTKQLIASHTYNELGELISKNIGGTNITGTTGLQKVDFTYNIRGWLTEINRISNLSQGSDPQDLFAFKINYNTVQNEIGYTGIEKYNGNISETYWLSASDNKLRKYGYKYDDLNRMKDAIYMRPSTTVLGNFNESLTYDKNGNIISLNRTGGHENPMATNIDNLLYGYEANSNKLIKVDDAANNPTGFKELVSTTTEYTYDAFGNMIKDDNKGISAITYNHLNLPKKVILPLGNITYLYNALGQKLSKVVVVTTPISNITTDYLDGFQYTNNTLDYFPHAEGYVTAGNKYVFQYKDHLGNVRISFKESTTVGTTTPADIIEENHYYPFGLKHNGYNGTIVGGFNTGNKYKYNGKELQEELGLNMTAMDFRQYDSAIGRFNSMDALAEEDYDITPYRFAYNNPLCWNDPTGLKEEGGQNISDYYRDKKGNVYFDPNVHGPGDVPDGTDYIGPTYYDEKNNVFWDEKGKSSGGGTVIEEVVVEGKAKKKSNSNPSGFSPWGPGMIVLGQPLDFLKPVGALGSKPGSSIASWTLSKAITYRSPLLKKTTQKVAAKVVGKQAAKKVGTAVVGRALGRFVPFAGWGLTAFDVYDNWDDLKWIPEAIKEGVESHSRMQQDPDTFVCFAKGTLVYTSNGLKPIDEIKVGDTTYSYNLKEKKTELSKVINILNREVSHIYKIITNTETVFVTAEHPIYVLDKGWIKVKDLKTNDLLKSFDVETKIMILEIQEIINPITVYNIEVDSNHNYYITNSKLLVHNKNISEIKDETNPVPNLKE